MMMSLAARTASLTALLLPALCFGPHARIEAQSGLATASADEQKIARTAYGDGLKAFEQKAYTKALERFDAADAAVSSPNVKLMRARCLAQLGRNVEAHVMYRAAVEEAKASSEDRYRASADAAAEEELALERKLALLTLSVDDETERAVLEINGQPLPRGRWGEPIAVEPGAVSITLEGPDGQHDAAERTVAAGTHTRLELAVVAHAQAPAPQEAAAAKAAAAPRPEATESATGGGPSALPIVLGAAGGAGLIAFAVFGAMSNARFSDLEQGCPSHKNCSPALADAASRGSTYQTVANVSLGVGLALLAAGTTLFVLDLQTEHVQVALTPGSVRLRGAL